MRTQFQFKQNNSLLRHRFPMRTFEVSAPAKVVLSGEHSVVYGKHALVGSIDKHMHLKVDEDFIQMGQLSLYLNDNKTSKIEISVFDLLQSVCSQFDSYPFTEKYSIILKNSIENGFVVNNSDGHTPQLISVIIAVCLHYISADFFSKCSLTINLRYEFPFGSGLGSSAALACCLAAYALVKREITPVNKNEINKLAGEIEKIFHANSSGMDNTCFSNEDIVVLIVNSGIVHSTKDAVLKVAELFQQDSNRVETILNTMDGITLDLFDKLNTLVGDFSTIKNQIDDLIMNNHNQLYQLGVGFKEARDITEICHSFGVHPKITGSGCGGCLIALLHKNDLPTLQPLFDNLTLRGFEYILTKFNQSGTVVHSS